MCYNPIFVKSQKAMMPCRQCLDCRLQRAKEWALRCHFEGVKHDKSSFLTLTYAPEHNPRVLKKEHFQLFIKRLRKKTGLKLKYFACAEYGERSYRPHFHIIVFGYRPPDLVRVGKSARGHDLYSSAELSALWQYGYHTVQDCTIATYVYSALYSAKPKKALPKALQNHPERNFMSQKLGFEGIMDDIETHLLTDEIWVDGKSYKIPDYILKKLYVTYDDNGRIVEKAPEYEELKAKRLEMYWKQNKSYCETADKIIALDEQLENGRVSDRLTAIKELLEAQKTNAWELQSREYRKRYKKGKFL